MVGGVDGKRTRTDRREERIKGERITGRMEGGKVISDGKKRK